MQVNFFIRFQNFDIEAEPQFQDEALILKLNFGFKIELETKS